MENIYYRKLQKRGCSIGIHLPPETLRFLEAEKGDVICITTTGQRNSKKIILCKNKQGLMSGQENKKRKIKDIIEVTEAQLLNIMDHLECGTYNIETAKKLIKSTLKATTETIT
jgi:bifunctional DNA-binding transcriptional regulator/antitoxin component of YhaV-PrlF toxin-antitoxin module